MTDISSTPTNAIRVQRLSFAYREQRVLDDVSLNVEPGAIFGLLGPNGSGKSTLFRLMATILPIGEGAIEVFGVDVARRPDLVRRLIGVAFQSPSLDGKLTVRENLLHQGHLYGFHGADLKSRIDHVVATLELGDRLSQMVDELSGGYRRRVELAKCLLHRPRLLLLDEPSTGLDPAVRQDLWKTLEDLRRTAGTTIVVTTHLMDEAESCERLALLDQGRLVATGSPTELRSSLGGRCLSLGSPDPARLARQIQDRFAVSTQQVGSTLRLESDRGPEFMRELLATFDEQLTSITLARPTLEDVFVARTGHRLDAGAAEEPSPSSRRRRRSS
jgi:ABC-2 type transport system ATP-binding protein